MDNKQEIIKNQNKQTMKNADKIRKDADAMSKDIKKMIIKFIDDNGLCSIDIDTSYHVIRHTEHSQHECQLTGIDVEVKVII